MLVCPFCRASNEEGRQTCAQCGRELRHGVQPSPVVVRRSPPSDLEPPPQIKPGPRWGRIAALGVVVLLGAGAGTWLAVRPQACDGKYSSTQFGYCVTVPHGWRASVAHIGPTDVDQFVKLPAQHFDDDGNVHYDVVEADSWIDANDRLKSTLLEFLQYLENKIH